MRNCRLICVVIYAALSGCVLGSGPCMWLGPVKSSVSGHVHFRDYPNADGMDNIPILLLDKTAYIYAPAQSQQCLAANELQLVGVTEFPQNVGENSHVDVQGTLFESVTGRQHTRFLVNVINMAVIKPPR